MTFGQSRNVNLHGFECVTVVTANPARGNISRADDEIVTQNCDLGLLAGKLNVITLPILTLERSEFSVVDAGDRLQTLGLGGDTIENVPTTGYHVVLPDAPLIVAPGTYQIKLGHSSDLGWSTEPLDWQVQPVDLLGEDVVVSVPEEDVRVLVMIDAPLPDPDLTPARSLSGCTPQPRVRASGNEGSWSLPLTPDVPFAMFLPFAGMGYKISTGTLELHPGFGPGEDLDIKLYRHEVPTGEPAFEGGSRLGGTFSLVRLDATQTDPLHCEGPNNPNNSRNQNFRLGTYIDLPAGHYREVITYNGFDPQTREFDLG